MKVFAIRDTACPEAGVRALVNASNARTARAHATPRLAATVATQQELVDWLLAGKEIERAAEGPTLEQRAEAQRDAALASDEPF